MPQWFKDLLPYLPNWISAFFTVVIAVATICYVVLTKRLWQETKNSADAAAQAARAAITSANLTVELHRPYMALQSVTLRNVSHPNQNWRLANAWFIDWSIANLGTLPAHHVHAKLELRSHDTPKVDEGPYDAEVYPQSQSLTRTTHLLVNPISVQKGSTVHSAHVVIEYAAPAGHRYRHTAQASFDKNHGIFSITESKTEAIEVSKSAEKEQTNSKQPES